MFSNDQGLNNYLTKPYSKDELEKFVLDKLINR
jgi:hypothetical protein